MTSPQIGAKPLERAKAPLLHEPTVPVRPRRGLVTIAAAVLVVLAAAVAIVSHDDPTEGRNTHTASEQVGPVSPAPPLQQRRTVEEEDALQVVERFLAAYAAGDADAAWSLITPAAQAYLARDAFDGGVANGRYYPNGNWAKTAGREMTAHKLNDVVVVNYGADIGLEGDPAVNSRFTSEAHYSTFIVRMVDGQSRLAYGEPTSPNTWFPNPDQRTKYADSSSGGGRSLMVSTEPITAAATKNPVEAYAIVDGAAPEPMQPTAAGMWTYAPAVLPGEHTFAAVFFTAEGGVGSIETPLTVTTSEHETVPPQR